MADKKKEHPKEKSKLHPRSKHRERYDLKQLTASCPELAPYVIVNAYKDETVNFSDPEAVKMLNTALLKHHYGIDYWNIPKNYLCPPIPGRADYIHHIADLLASNNNGVIPTGKGVVCLDIGVGANCVYPIIGNKEYGWSFIGSDIDKVALEAARKIVATNKSLEGIIEFRPQTTDRDIFKGVIKKDERIDLCISNPPFHASAEEAQAATQRKATNLSPDKAKKPILNFGGQNRELWCPGGEKRFVRDMVRESRQYASSCFWFSTLISKQANLNGVLAELKKVHAMDVRILPMGQGNKISRVVAWTFLNETRQQKWMTARWNEADISDEATSQV